MFTKEEKITRLKSLSRIEMEVLFYFCQKMTDDELRKAQEANQKRDEWKRTLYTSKLEKTPRYKKYEPYVLTDEQMDNDPIIDLLNQEPANKRDSNFLGRVNF